MTSRAVAEEPTCKYDQYLDLLIKCMLTYANEGAVSQSCSEACLARTSILTLPTTLDLSLAASRTLAANQQ
jgi:hypothetical protein